MFDTKPSILPSLLAALCLLSGGPALANVTEAQVNAALHEALPLKADEIEVEVKNQTVYLRGGPLSEDKVNEASLSVAKLDGVEEIVNELFFGQS
ncbi:MAG: BON domain-containing protein [Gammaproteobacteria bacterium]|nr:BON domain-containing protein [Gammaproteobacteria bacterium]